MGQDIGDSGVAASLRQVRFEVLPLAGVEEQIAHVPDGATVTVTSSPAKGLEATLALCERLRDRGVVAIPHVAARLLRGRDDVAALLRRLDGSGISEVFVVAGDIPNPAGPYEGAVELLQEMSDLGHTLDRVGVTGYPESHAFIPDGDTIRAMDAKAPHASYIVSQICYDPHAVERWVTEVRARGIALPIYVGIPGAVDMARLLRISMKVGLGDSVRFLRKQGGVVRRLVAGYSPDPLVEGLAHLLTDPASAVAGWHLFTFNEVENTEQWRQARLARAQGVSA